MAVTVSNPRDLLVLQLAQLLFVERRLADEVLQDVIDAAQHQDLVNALREHREETKEHATRIETVFRRIEVAPSSNLVRAFESAVEQHDEEAGNIKVDALGDVFHAQTALHTEHWEIAQYTAVLALAEAMGRGDDVKELRDTLKEEEHARDRLQKLLDHLTNGACAR